tara:strand:+ start:288 stop:413 length:126 start_codon:yes stop_codon:yes gene_type:complete
MNNLMVAADFTGTAASGVSTTPTCATAFASETVNFFFLFIG